MRPVAAGQSLLHHPTTYKEGSQAVARKTTTSYEVKRRWDEANLVTYAVRLRKDSDGDLIDYIESLKAQGMNTSTIFREAIQKLKSEG